MAFIVEQNLRDWFQILVELCGEYPYTTACVIILGVPLLGALMTNLMAGSPGGR